MKNYRRVVIVEEFWKILKQVHDKNCFYAGIQKTNSRVRLKLHSSIVEPSNIHYEPY